MGIDVDIFIKHNFFEKNIVYTLEKLKEISSYDIIICDLHKNPEMKVSTEWVVSIDGYSSVEECFEKDKYISIIRHLNTEKEIEIWFSKNSFEISGEEYLIRGRWYYFSKFLIGDMDKETFNDFKNWFEYLSQRIKDYSEIFGSNEFIMFCGDLNQDTSNELWKGETFENVLNKKNWTIINEIPYTIDFNNYENYDIPRFLFHKKWENKIFNINKWKKLFG